MNKILLLFILLTGSLYAQPPIGQPNNLEICDQNSDGFEAFDLTVTIPEILNGLNPSLFSITFYTSLADAQNEMAPIVNPAAYINSSNPQTIFVRVLENANPTNFAITSFDLIVSVPPAIVQPPNLVIYQSPFVGAATFNLSSQNAFLINGNSSVFVSYYVTQSDAVSGSSMIVSATAFTNSTNPQTIYSRVEDMNTGCFSITSFDLIVAEDGIVFIPDVNFKAKLIAANITNTTASIVNPNNSETWNVYSKIDTNNDGEIQYSEAQSIIYLNVSGNTGTNGGIQSLQGLEAFYNLVYLKCDYNQLTNVDLTVCPNLFSFHASNNVLTSINLNNSEVLEILNCSYNQLTNINVSQCTNLKFLVVRNNQLTSLNVENNEQIQSVTASYNNLTEFQLHDKGLFRTLELGFNQLTNMELSNLPFLYRVKAQNNNLTHVDLSGVAFQIEPNNLPNANVLDIALNNNINLAHIILKNGFINSNIDLMTSNLSETQQYICVDEYDVFNYFSTTPNPNVNTYCSFNPGGNYNTITGTIQYDFNNNGCDTSDPYANYFGLEVNIDGISTNSSVYSNGLGVYNLFTSNTGVYGLTPNLENPLIFNVTPSPAEIPVMTIDNSTTTQNFCISANGVHPDLEVVIAPVIPARPGFEAVYKIVYKNKGNQVMSQNYGLNFFYNHNLMSLVSTSVVPSAQATGGLQWDYANLMPFESRSILVTFLINAPTDTNNPVNIDDVLTFTSVISPQTGDVNVIDNTFVFNQSVVGSYDPNDITCLQGDLAPPSSIGDYLHYMIRFENTGNAPAENIVVKTEIDATQYNINSLQMLSASHNATVRRTGNKIEFIFQNIQLDSGGHGNILLKITSRENLQEGDFVSKMANIYFDYNFPIETNEAETLFAALSINNPEWGASVSVYPNSVNDWITISSKDKTIKTIELYDIGGRLLQTLFVNDLSVELNMTARSSGIYFLKISTDSGSMIEKVIKN